MFTLALCETPKLTLRFLLPRPRNGILHRVTLRRVLLDVRIEALEMAVGARLMNSASLCKYLKLRALSMHLFTGRRHVIVQLVDTTVDASNVSEQAFKTFLQREFVEEHGIHLLLGGVASPIQRSNLTCQLQHRTQFLNGLATPGVQRLHTTREHLKLIFGPSLRTEGVQLLAKLSETRSRGVCTVAMHVAQSCLQKIDSISKSQLTLLRCCHAFQQ
mmetsp:Transcript_21235/g.56718  ORF Transcript_21235/g.56718 Transcript_21235/m.56718 type:complete len:217 (-) Transcript_21235:952-1602(-)